MDDINESDRKQYDELIKVKKENINATIAYLSSNERDVDKLKELKKNLTSVISNFKDLYNKIIQNGTIKVSQKIKDTITTIPIGDINRYKAMIDSAITKIKN